MLDPILEPFAAEVARVRLSAPAVPIVSTVTGRALTPAEATSPDYWTRHFRVPVRFSDALATLFEEPARLLLEVGPGQALATLAKAHPSRAGQGVFASLPRPEDESPEDEHLLGTLGSVWAAGVDVDWPAHQAGERRNLVAAPAVPVRTQEVLAGRGSGLGRRARARRSHRLAKGPHPSRPRPPRRPRRPRPPAIAARASPRRS